MFSTRDKKKTLLTFTKIEVEDLNLIPKINEDFRLNI